MFSRTPTGRASKGSVSIINIHDRLQLRFRVQGKRYYLSTGLADTLANRRLAQLKASEIEKDILYDRVIHAFETDRYYLSFRDKLKGDRILTRSHFHRSRHVSLELASCCCHCRIQART
jgi:hypothetical protein